MQRLFSVKSVFDSLTDLQSSQTYLYQVRIGGSLIPLLIYKALKLQAKTCSLSSSLIPLLIYKALKQQMAKAAYDGV